MEGPNCKDEEQAQDQDQKLQLLLENLEHEWDFIKKKPERTLYRTSSGSRKMTRTLGLLDENSPRKIMSPALMEDETETAWKVRTNDLAVEEILRDRRAAIESGKLKGRRLFEEVEDHEVRSVFSYEYDDNNNTYEDDINWPGTEHLLSSPSCPRCSYSCSLSSSSSLCGGSGTEMATMVVRKTGCENDVGRGRTKLNFIKVWGVAICSIGLIVGIISTWSFGVFEDEEVILTPT